MCDKTDQVQNKTKFKANFLLLCTRAEDGSANTYIVL